MTRRHRSVQHRFSSAIAIAFVIAAALAVHPLGARAAALEESPSSSAEATSSPAQTPSEPMPAGIADLLSLAFIALLWTLSNKAARHHHRSTRPRRNSQGAVALERRTA